MLFRVAVDAFIQFCAVERGLSSHTTQAYTSDLGDFHRRLSGNSLTTTVTTTTLKEYLNSMVIERKLSSSTVRRRFACLRSFFGFLAERHGLPDPFVGLRLKLPRRKRLPRALSRQEISTLVGPLESLPSRPKSADETMFGTIIRLMISTGLRVGEVCKLQAGDVSSDGSKIRVRGKGAKERIAYVTDPVLMQELISLRNQQILLGLSTLFPNRRGSSMRPQSIRLRLRKLAIEEGLARRITPHMLRHTAATLLIETGVDIRFVQRLLGHSSIATTELYTHVSDEALRNTLAKANVLGLIATL